MLVSANVTSQNQITIPKKVREFLGITKNNKIDFLIDNKKNQVIVSRKRTASEIDKMFEKFRGNIKKLDEKDVKNSIEEGRLTRYKNKKKSESDTIIFV